MGQPGDPPEHRVTSTAGGLGRFFPRDSESVVAFVKTTLHTLVDPTSQFVVEESRNSICYVAHTISQSSSSKEEEEEEEEKKFKVSYKNLQLWGRTSKGLARSRRISSTRKVEHSHMRRVTSIGPRPDQRIWFRVYWLRMLQVLARRGC